MIFLIGAALLIIFTYLIYSVNKRANKLQNELDLLRSEPFDKQLFTSDVTHERLKDMETRIDDLPGRVLESINGSISNQKGKLAELIAYVNLKAGYDKVIPLGNIVDFIGIRFPSDTDPGTFDFIDVKNGKSARLSEDQKQLQKLIKTQSIQFLKVKIITDNVANLPKDDISGSDPVI